MHTTNDDVSREIASAHEDEQALADSAQRSLTINRDGSGHTFNITDTTGVIVVGLIALILLSSLLRSEARNRRLQAQLRPDG